MKRNVFFRTAAAIAAVSVLLSAPVPAYAEGTDSTLPVTFIVADSQGETDDNYTLKFDPGEDAVVRPSTRKVKYGNAWGELPVPEKEGYSFDGWYTAPDDSGTYFDGAIPTDASTPTTQTVYAHWKEAYYTVHFNGNGATSGSMEDERFAPKERKALAENHFMKTGYVFKGWSTSKKAVSAKYEDMDEVSALGLDGQTVNLYAVWEVNTNMLHYNIHFDGNGATGGVMEDESFGLNERKALTMNTFVRSGYTFVGWATSQNSQVVKYANQEEISGLGMPDDVINLYAVWLQNSAAYTVYTIHFDGNGGSGSMENEPMMHGMKKSLSKNAFTNTSEAGLAFLGWSLKQDAVTADFTDGCDVMDIPDEDGDGIVTLYAIWKTGVYTITVPTVVQINDVSAGPVETSSEPYEVTVKSLAPDNMLGENVNVELKQIDIASTDPSNHLTLMANSTGNPMNYIKTDTKTDQLNLTGEIHSADTWSGMITYTITETPLG